MNLYIMTPGVPDFPYAGGPVLRRIIRHLDIPVSKWVCLTDYKGKAPVKDMPVLALPGSRMPYRIKISFIGTWIRSYYMAMKRAGKIYEDIRKSGDKTMLWILAEGEDIYVAYYLVRRYNLPVHLTFHDAPEVYTGMLHSYPRYEEKIYLSRVKYLLRNCHSVDAISGNLLKHLSADNRIARKMVFMPSFPAEYFQSNSLSGKIEQQDVVKIGFCGTARESKTEWEEFLGIIGGMAQKFELILYTDNAYYPQALLPENVTLKNMGYADTEEDLIQNMRDHGLFALYIGQWKEPGKALFARTSISSKLATYSAIGLPAIYNGPEDSASWELLNKYDCGIPCFPGVDKTRSALDELMCDKALWSRKCRNANRLGLEEFNMDKNIQEFSKIINL
jgi:hypothetical protein